MNLVRSTISVFLLALLVLSIAGWIWSSGLPASKMEGARVVLAICAVASVGSLVLLWTAKQAQVR
jgi:hypothetical protein